MVAMPHWSGTGTAMGGEGGEAGQAHRGGRGDRSPAELLGLPNILLPDGTCPWDRGPGGDGGEPPTSTPPESGDETEK
jgi:hypothetical protein